MLSLQDAFLLLSFYPRHCRWARLYCHFMANKITIIVMSSALPLMDYIAISQLLKVQIALFVYNVLVMLKIINNFK